jgi:hypothetical protein
MKRRQKPVPTYLINEHNEAFSAWHRARYEGYLQEPLDLFHVDAHDDMGRPESLRQSLYFPPGSQDGYLEYYKTLAAQELNIAGFILPGVLNGLIRNIYFIYPPWRQYKPHRKKFNVASAFGEGRILKYGMKMDPKADSGLFHKTLPDLKHYLYAMLPAERVPKNRKVILDIDLDYFACRDSILNHLDYELEITREQFQEKEKLLADRTLTFARLDFHFEEREGQFFARIAHKKGKEIAHLPSREEIRTEIDTLVTTLQSRQTRPAAITIARSCISGYCPQDYADFIETELTQRLKTWLGPSIVS